MSRSDEGVDDTYRQRKGWSTGGKLITENESKSLSLQANFDEPGAYTVQFNVFIPQDAAAARFRVEAWVAWSVEGNESVRRMTLGTGGNSISGVGQAVRVVVKDDTFLDAASPFEYSVAIMVAPGARSGQFSPPTWVSDEGGSVGPGANRDFEVPQDLGATCFRALIYSPNGVAIPDQGITVEQQSVTGANLGGCDPRDFEWITLLPGCANLHVENASLAQAENVRIVFGIDG